MFPCYRIQRKNMAVLTGNLSVSSTAGTGNHFGNSTDVDTGSWIDVTAALITGGVAIFLIVCICFVVALSTTSLCRNLHQCIRTDSWLVRRKLCLSCVVWLSCWWVCNERLQRKCRYGTVARTPSIHIENEEGRRPHHSPTPRDRDTSYNLISDSNLTTFGETDDDARSASASSRPSPAAHRPRQEGAPDRLSLTSKKRSPSGSALSGVVAQTDSLSGSVLSDPYAQKQSLSGSASSGLAVKRGTPTGSTSGSPAAQREALLRSASSSLAAQSETPGSTPSSPVAQRETPGSASGSHAAQYGRLPGKATLPRAIPGSPSARKMTPPGSTSGSAATNEGETPPGSTSSSLAAQHGTPPGKAALPGSTSGSPAVRRATPPGSTSHGTPPGKVTPTGSTSSSLASKNETPPGSTSGSPGTQYETPAGSTSGSPATQYGTPPGSASSSPAAKNETPPGSASGSPAAQMEIQSGSWDNPGA